MSEAISVEAPKRKRHLLAQPLQSKQREPIFDICGVTTWKPEQLTSLTVTNIWIKNIWCCSC